MREKILAKIAKLKAMSESAEEIGSSHEAAAFAVEVQRLCDKYHLSIEEIDVATAAEDQKIGSVKCEPDEFKRARSWWKVELAMTVAKAHHCSSMGARSTNIVWFVGRQLDRECASWVYSVLIRYMEKGAKIAYREARKKGLRTRGFYREYYRGFLVEIQRRYAHEKIKQEMELSESQAMTLAKPEVKIMEWMEAKKIGTIKAPPRPQVDLNREGLLAGMGDGARAPLRSRGLETTNNTNVFQLENSDESIAAGGER